MTIIINSSSKYIFVNSINTILNNTESKAVTKGGIDKISIERVLLLINLIGEALNKKIFLTLRVSDNELENNIQHIIDGVCWGYLIINNNYVTFHNRDVTQNNNQIISKKILADSMTEIKKVL